MVKYVVLLFLTLTGLPGQGSATTLTYTSEGIVEFDMFHQLSWSGFYWELPFEPRRAAWAKLHIDFDEVLDPDNAYILTYDTDLSQKHIDNLSIQTDRPYQTISGFTLRVETDSRTYQVPFGLFYEDSYIALDLYVDSGSGQVMPSFWKVNLEFGDLFYYDHFFLLDIGGGGGVSWYWEYYEYPEQEYPTDDLYEGSYSNGRLAFAQPPITPVSLPAPLLLLLGGVGALCGLRRARVPAVA